jgi:hypothetical protein
MGNQQSKSKEELEFEDKWKGEEFKLKEKELELKEKELKQMKELEDNRLKSDKAWLNVSVKVIAIGGVLVAFGKYARLTKLSYDYVNSKDKELKELAGRQLQKIDDRILTPELAKSFHGRYKLVAIISGLGLAGVFAWLGGLFEKQTIQSPQSNYRKGWIFSDKK